jgi:steroid Delta-isomerase
MDEQPSPAQVARAAMTAVQTGQRDAWLALFTADTRVEDPVGHLPPIAGRAALAQFWDGAISALASVSFDVTREWETGEEAMLLATVTIATAAGASASYDGAFNYVIDGDGKIASLRAFWDLPAVGAALAG